MHSKIFKSLFEIILCTVFGVLMYISDIAMELLPNIHLLAMFIVTFTVVFRFKALISIYVYVFITGLTAGFSLWWVPYTYVWTVLWAVVMLLPQFKSPRVAIPVYMATCALHGILFGVLYAPAQALMFGLDFKGIVTWIIAGLPFDVIHSISNFFAGLLVYPLSIVLKKILSNVSKP